MNNQKVSSLIGITVSLVLVAILLPIGINQLSTAEIGYYEITSCNTPDRTVINWENQTSQYNNSFWEYNVSVVWITIEWNTSALPSTENYTMEFTISSTNASAVNITNIQVIANEVVDQGNFSTMMGSEFGFGTKFTTPEIPVAVTAMWLNITLTILSNSTVSVNSRLLQFDTNDNTETVSTLFAIIPIIAVVGVVLKFVDSKQKQ